MQLKLQAQGQKWTSAGSEALWKRFKSASERFVPVIPEALSKRFGSASERSVPEVLSKRFGSASRCAFAEALQSASEALQTVLTLKQCRSMSLVLFIVVGHCMGNSSPSEDTFLATSML